ncbi:MAG: four helix bundle protein [Candidatus Blackburnbacteria bacterium]|nr:four helix bundle protein [Candidatus Blackburnbacteria bacterium]
MKTGKEKFKNEFRRRIFGYIIRLIRFVDSLGKNDSVCRIVGDQLIRSGTSFGANYVEAQAASSKKNFIVFFHHCLKSCNESLFWLEIFQSTKRGDSKERGYLLEELKETSAIFGSSLLTLKGRRNF